MAGLIFLLDSLMDSITGNQCLNHRKSQVQHSDIQCPWNFANFERIACCSHVAWFCTLERRKHQKGFFQMNGSSALQTSAKSKCSN